MRILEAQSAVLTNVEVYGFLKEQAQQYQAQKRRGPGNLEMLRGEMIKYFETDPSPLSQKIQPYDASAIPPLLQKLRQFGISKGECIMIVNLRPTTEVGLNVVIEQMDTRFTKEQQDEILAIIVDSLGQFPIQEEAADAMDVVEAGS
ncbi:RNA polymerase Rpb4-domain-containing protein [Xylariaceae sp. FL1272]|nr:RNA polymerase Rpb4-domain-containing protein [Xylariaceae sp. FL1272]